MTPEFLSIDLKSNKEKSARWLGTTFCMALNMVSIRPGKRLSQSLSICFTAWRCKLGCEPHKLHGMIG
ncbi:Uncharacterised protein [Vibrio cholerae]|nr:Uncharacterised protein [Vibrio cholerae]